MAKHWIALALVGCATERPVDTGPEPGTDEGCEAGPARMELAHGDRGYGEVADGDPVWYGWPPQGGAPYAPFDVRFAGLGTDEVEIELVATAVDDGAELGFASYLQRFVCANTGANDGWYVTSELHMRFFGYELDELAGREVDVAVRIVGAELEQGFRGPLTPLP